MKKYLKKYSKEYLQRPEVKKRRREQATFRYQQPGAKEKRKKYLQKPKIKEYYEEYRQQPRNKARAKEYQKEYRQRPEVKLKRKEYRQKAKKYYREYSKEYQKEYRQQPKVKEYRNNYQKEKCRIDIRYAIICRLRNRKNIAIRNAIKTGKIPKGFEFKGVKIDYNSILKVLQPFPKDISKYHIDEIFPFAAVNWNNIKDIKRVLSPKNHQWLTVQENLSKGPIIK